ncbi:sialin-like isoform X3 [Panulirus ornatus]|uniref:sialin-like isoform X3 n=1 Tax=Panulirus ornatus TaxID=150431 RepID=UPI003A8A58F9
MSKGDVCLHMKKGTIVFNLDIGILRHRPKLGANSPCHTPACTMSKFSGSFEPSVHDAENKKPPSPAAGEVGRDGSFGIHDEFTKVSLGDDQVSSLEGSSVTLVQRDDTQRPKECWGGRHTLGVLGSLGFAAVYAMRVNLSVAIVAMVGSDVVNSTNSSDSNVCPYPDDFDFENSGNEEGEFDWDTKVQGQILGSFFYGYIFTNLLGGRAAEYFGGKMVFGMGIFLTAILTILSPLCARASTELFIAVRVLEGLTEGVTFPAMSFLLATWIPPMERAKFSSLVYCGVQFGTVITLSLTGYLCDSDFLGGWPSAFYVFGGLGILWSVAWFTLVFDHPDVHPRISQEEKDYIIQQRGNNRSKPVPLPLRAAFSVPVVALSFVHLSNNWGFYTLLTELPTYFKNIQHFNMKRNGLLSSLPYLVMWIFSIVYSNVMDRLLTSGKLAIITVRRTSMTIGFLGPMVGLVAMCFVNCDSLLAMVVLCVAVGLNGAVYCGYMCSHQDLAPNLAGSLMGVTNTLATVPGFVTPALTGAIISHNESLNAWRTVFLIASGIYLFGCIIFFLLVPTTVQPWNEVTSSKDHQPQCEQGDTKEKY